jgi:hypothetical protein
MIKLLLIVIVEATAKLSNLASAETRLVSKTIDTEGQHVAVYNYTALDDKIICGAGTKCSGWQVYGQYKVVTNIEGDSRVELTGTVHSPHTWASGGIVGIAWNFPFETNKKETEQVLL